LQSRCNRNTIDKDIYLNQTKGKIMAKGKDSQKAVKKTSDKSLKEKRKEKKEKKANKGKISIQ
jgi:hypothetical protein